MFIYGFCGLKGYLSCKKLMMISFRVQYLTAILTSEMVEGSEQRNHLLAMAGRW